MNIHKVIRLGIVASIAIFISSCQSDEPSLGMPDVPTSSQKESITFTYKGSTYTSTYEKGEEKLILDDNTAKSVYNELMSNPNLATLVNENGTLEFYDTHEDLNEAHGWTDEEYLEDSEMPEDTQTRAFKAGQCTIWFYDNGNYTGTPLLAADFYNSFNKANMVSIGWNDRVSSIRMINYGTKNYAKITLFEHINFAGRALCIMPIKNDRRYWLFSLETSFPCLNNQVSSYKATFYKKK
ncbi:MAG: hypothetical protein E6772_07500 [Dysgonomonas sp.]|nr:hypothetical protein [Dysgonomonas sp.]